MTEAHLGGHAHSQHGRSRAGATQQPARNPTAVGAKGWWAALRRAWPRNKLLHIPLLASGVAFWGLLSLFPTLLAIVTLYGLVASPQQATAQVDNLLGNVSSSAKDIVSSQITSITSGQSQGLSWGLGASLLGLLWTASSGMQNLMKALTTAYEQKESRGFIALRAKAILLSIGGLVAAVLVVAALAAAPALSAVLDNQILRWAALIVGYAILFALVVTGLALLYRFGPANQPAGLRWASAGALVAAVLWLLGTVAFAVYISHFSHYGNVYGALAGVIVLMLWLYLTSYAILFGALIDAELERQARGNAPSHPENAPRDVVRTPATE